MSSVHSGAMSLPLKALKPQPRFLAGLPSIPPLPWPLFRMYFGGTHTYVQFLCFLSGDLFPHLQSGRTAHSGPCSPAELSLTQDETNS